MQALKALGVMTAFDTAADFSRVSDASPLMLSDVLHTVSHQ
jgi:serine protease inhibitor